jgi:hypothetical protein
MNDEHNQKQERATKGLAVAGFIGLLLALAWLIFTIVSYLPSLVSNVASVISSEPDLELATFPKKESVEHNENVTVTWNTVSVPGTFSLTVSCVPGVTVKRSAETIDCDTPHDLGAKTSTSLTLQSTEERFADVPYEISFVADENPDQTVRATNRIAVFNPNISLLGDNASTSTVADNSAEEETNLDDSESGDNTPPPNTTSEDTTPSEPTYTTQYQYTTPTSDPNGTTNLAVQYLGVGSIQDDNEFVPSATLMRNSTGAIRFRVTNIGTRTSEIWSYEANLPNEQTYESNTQGALKPNESATITLGFNAPDASRQYDFSVTVSTDRETSIQDNEFSWAAAVE